MALKFGKQEIINWLWKWTGRASKSSI